MKNSTLGLLLNLGESFTSLNTQAELMLASNILSYAKAFRRVYIFTYLREKISLPDNCHLINPPKHLHRYVYALLLPIIHRRTIRECNLLRCFQLAGTLPALIAKFLYGNKFVFNYGYDYVQLARIEGKPVAALLFSLLKSLALGIADGVIFKSKSLLASSYALNPKFIYIPNGVNTTQFHPPKSADYLINQLSKKPVILFVGRLEPQKNLLALIEAVAHLPQQSQLTFIGAGSLKRQLIDRAAKLHVNLRLLPPARHSLLVNIYRKATIFILPSLIEGSPKVLLEAMACGLPCLVSNIPEHREIITHKKNGWLVEATSVKLTAALNTLLKSPSLRRQLGKNSRKNIIKHFDLNQTIDREIIFLKQQVR